jgi:bifunctional enzyme CysN/CysC
MRAFESIRAKGQKSQLRFLTCGSVDDGKSTLIGRLLYDTDSIADDQRQALKKDSERFGTTGGALDFALLTDGLEDERQQGITIDVAFRYFSSARRSFVVADTPGHEQYTRNMATGASTAELAILLVDARKGLLTQTMRHAAVTSLMGIRHVVLAINKLDLMKWDQKVFDDITNTFAAHAERLGFVSVVAIPLSALHGDNVTVNSANTPWYKGTTLLDYLENIEIGAESGSTSFRLPVQTVLRVPPDVRLFAGTLAGKALRRGDRVAVASSGRESTITDIFVAGERQEAANPGQAIAVALADQIDVGRGEVLAPPDDLPSVANQFAAHLVWMSKEPLLPGRSYLIKMGTRTLPASVTGIKHRLNVETLEHQAARSLEMNEIGICNLATTHPVAFDDFTHSRRTGSFILVDRYSNATLAAGMIDFALRRGENIHPIEHRVSKQARAGMKQQRPVILWFTGLSGSGKSTIANAVEARLAKLGRHSYLLDGDNMRSGLNKDLGFKDEDRVENIRRIGEVAKLFVDSGLIVLCAFISPFRNERREVRNLVGTDEFLEIFVEAPLEICEARDPKGLYAKSRAGKLSNFTGIDSPYEEPENPAMVLHTAGTSVDELADRVIAYLAAHSYFEAMNTDEG